MLQAYEREQVPDDKISLLSSLAMFRKEELVRKILDISLTNRVRLQDSFIIPARATQNPIAHKILVDWTFENWQKLKENYLEGTMMLRRFVTNLGVLKDANGLKRYSSFFAQKTNIRDDIKREVGLTAERIEANIAMMKRSLEF